MHIVHVIGILVAFACNRSSAEVDLKQGMARNITFEGAELIVRVDNSYGKNGDFRLCFESISGATNIHCPPGYLAVGFLFVGFPRIRQMKINRHGQVFLNSGALAYTLKDVAFGDKEVITVTVAQVPDISATITLLNANVYVPKQEEPVKVETKEGSMGMIGIVISGLVVIASLIVTVFVAWYCCCRNTVSKKDAPEHYEEHLPSTRRNARSSGKSPKPTSPTVTTPTKKKSTTPVIGASGRQTQASPPTDDI